MTLPRPRRGRALPEPLTLAEALHLQRLAWSEEQFGDAILAFALPLGWWGVHFRPARTAKGWRTPFSGSRGFPDLVLARDGEVHFRELKRAKGWRWQPGQQEWLQHTGGSVWTPHDWDAICALLLAPRAPP